MSVLTQFVTYFADGLRALANFFAFLGDQKWAAAIVALTIIIRTALLPLAIKQIKSMREQQRLNPEVQRLRQKYKGDRQAMNQELMALYQREGVNPMAACLPLVVQMPILIAINGAIRRLTSIPLLTLKHVASYATAHHLSGDDRLVKAAQKLHLKAPQDKLQAIAHFASQHHTSVLHAAQQLHIVEKMPFLMFGDLSNPASSSVGGWLLIISMTIISLLSAIQINVGGTQQQRQMQLLTPLLFTVFFIRFPTALLLYWTTQQLYQFVQQSIMTRDMRKESGGWLAMLPWKSKSSGKPSGKRAPQRSVERARPATAVAATTTATSVQSPQARRDLEDKRRRRRNNKKKKKRRR